MSNGAPQVAQIKILTVSDLIAELCRWPDHANIRLLCRDTGTLLNVIRIDSASKDRVDIELQSLPETAPIVPA